MGENIKSQTNHNEGQPIHYLQPLIVMDSDIKVHCMLISMFNCPGWWKNNSNRRCCQFKTQPTTGQNLHFFFFLPALHRGIRKVVFKKTQSCNTPTKLVVILFAQHTLAIMRVFHTAYACSQNAHVPDSFLANSFADFQYSAGKKSRFRSVVGGIWK